MAGFAALDKENAWKLETMQKRIASGRKGSYNGRRNKHKKEDKL